MQFVDNTNLIVRAGDGGKGVVSFRREKYIPRGGPDGGNGGKGGSIYFVGDDHLNTLLDYKYRSVYKATTGVGGKGKCRNGSNGEDVILPVPLGTLVHNVETQEILGELLKDGDKLLVAHGGNGGLGNAAFKSSVNRAPTQSTPGSSGETRNLYLELRLITDAALVGLPNAGKSSLLGVMSAARPKVADYPFTTLTPHPGIVNIGLSVDEKPFVITDIPGILEGAAEGHGLGITFLRHIKRSLLLLHVVDLTSDDIVKDVEIFNKELKNFSSEMVTMPKWLLGNKADLLEEEELAEKTAVLRELNSEVFIVSAKEKQGLKTVSRSTREFLDILEEKKATTEHIEITDTIQADTIQDTGQTLASKTSDKSVI
ncbi:MAG: GTPase ObgE [Candidatus Portiera sp.]|nr:GTPase ObgE [Portiera sp.]